ncbi:MAG: VanZ family protein [Planctomycetes bacterium]|nr:VanZ family protein [Planctomycetota bacterium]
MLKLDNYFDIKWLVLAVTFAVFVLILTHVPQEFIPSQLHKSGLDKLQHVVAYGIITFLFILSLKNSPSMLSSLLIFFTLLAIGMADEITLPLVNRQASYADLAADAIGLVTVLLFSAVCKYRFRNTKKRISRPDKP